MRTHLRILTAALGAALASASPAAAASFAISTLGGNTINGSPFFRGGDIVQYDDVAGTVTQIFNEDTFADPGVGPEVDAFELLSNGHMLFSTTDPSTLGVNLLAFVDGDIVEYDPVSQLATRVFDEQLNFNGQADVDAVAALPNGHLLFSTEDNEILSVGNINITDGDVIEWNPVTNAIVGTYLDESLFGGLDVDIDAFDVLDDGRWVLSTAADASLAGLAFTDSDLVLYDPVGGAAVKWIQESIFGNPSGSPLDAIAIVSIPEPNALTLLAMGLVGLAFVGRRPGA